MNDGTVSGGGAESDGGAGARSRGVGPGLVRAPQGGAARRPMGGSGRNRPQFTHPTHAAAPASPQPDRPAASPPAAGPPTEGRPAAQDVDAAGPPDEAPPMPLRYLFLPRRPWRAAASLTACLAFAAAAVYGLRPHAAPAGPGFVGEASPRDPFAARTAHRPADTSKTAGDHSLVEDLAGLDLPSESPDRRALRRTVELLEDGQDRLAALPHYKVRFHKHEVVDGYLLDPQVMDLKVRHDPSFAVYLRWVEGSPGREILYEEGRRDGAMLCYPGGWRARITGTLALDPGGSLAMGESRRPVTDLGYMNLGDRVLEFRRRELAEPSGVKCTLDPDDEFDGRPCWRSEVVYAARKPGVPFRKSVLWIDREHNFPVAIENFGWPVDRIPADRLDAETLLERYAYTGFDPDAKLGPKDWDETCPDYVFAR